MDGGEEEEEVLNKIQISGPLLASLLHRFSSSPASIHGLLFGHLSLSNPCSSLSDDVVDPLLTTTTTTTTATITSFISFPSHSPLPDYPPCSSSLLLGWFSGRRNTPPRPSLFESTTNSWNISRPKSIFLLFTTPFQDQLIHTHEYKAYHYSTSIHSFQPISLDIINVGPSFPSHYSSFTPISLFPFISSSTTPMIEDDHLNDHKEFDAFGSLMGSGAAHYTAELELLYAKMLAKLEALTTSVETSSAKVAQQENHNMKLRLKVAGLE